MEWMYTTLLFLDHAVSSAVPRLIFLFSKPEKTTYWNLWFVLSLAVVLITWKLKGKPETLN